MLAALLAAALPALYWDGPPEGRKPAVERMYVPAARAAAWRSKGVNVEALDPMTLVKALTPDVRYRVNEASATRAPWVDSNAWRFARQPDKTFFYDLPEGAVARAVAEARARGAKAVFKIAAADLENFERVLAFVQALEQEPGSAVYNIAIADDGSAQAAEVLNLLARRNLLFRIGGGPADLIVGARETRVSNPSEAVQAIRQKLGDERRVLRIYGSEVVLGNMNAGGGRARVHLINYGRRPVEGLRVRVRGEFRTAEAHIFGIQKPVLADFEGNAGATEFTVRDLPVYGVVDLK